MSVDLLDDDGLLDLRGRARGTDPAAVAAEERRRSQATPARNPALREWLHEAGIDTVDAPAAAPPEADGRCLVCRDRAGRHTCRQCEALVCAAHYWLMFGLCHRCASAERVRRWHAAPRPEDGNWLDLGGPEVGP